MAAAISDDFLATLTAVGDEDAVRAGHPALPRRRRDVAVLGPIPKTDFAATLRAGRTGGMSMREIDRDRLGALLERELARFAERTRGRGSCTSAPRAR